MSIPKFSVLIPSVRRRADNAIVLFDELESQLAKLNRPDDVEILSLLDNKKRSIGMKRQALLDVARGEFVAFVDDDDWIAPEYLDRILTTIETLEVTEAAERDRMVIVFPTTCQLNGGPVVRVNHELQYPNEEYHLDGFRRKPWHMHPWRRTLVQKYRFPDISYGEDWGWLSLFVDQPRFALRAHTEPLYHYRYDERVSEAAV